MNLPQKSVFEEALDVTDIHPDKRADAMDTRWKFTGPWLAGMTQGEFSKWLAKHVRPKRPEFRQFLKKKIASELHAAAAKEALDKGLEQPAVMDASAVTEDQLIDYLRKLRHDNQALYDMVGQFLDLAPIAPPTVSQTGLPKERVNNLRFNEMKNPYAQSGPPVTHPSAGLSYLRTSMYMENHPIYGPQKQHAPAVARVLKPRRQAQASAARFGVAGFVVNTTLGDTAFNRGSGHALFDKLDPTIEGGAKVWVQPQRASVDSSGRIVLTVGETTRETTLVAQELLGDAVCLGVQPAEDEMNKRESASEIRQRYRAQDSPAMSSAQDYGLRE
jgi:hypothetical protein